jgi:glycosyltransferase involved in cell wall biosynthesis
MIIIIQGILPHYRRDVFNEMCKHDDLLVVHSGVSNKQDQDKFREFVLPLGKIGPFRIQKGLFKLIKQENPHTVIAMFDIRWIYSVILMYLSDSKIKWIWWGMDKGISKIALEIKLLIAKRNNAIVFYNSHIKQEMIDKGVNVSRCFVANNTFHVGGALPCFDNPIKDTFINVGSLDSRKQNDVTIRVFKNILLRTNLNLKLVFIGDGLERKILEDLAMKEKLFDNVSFIGHIENKNTLEKYYRSSIASVSFGQAGLAVLQSMAYGVPFVTKENAISGGEKHNIIHRENGIFCKNNPESLEKVMFELVRDNDFAYARKLGKNAYNYYKSKASIENMANSFIRAQGYSKK